MRKQITYTNWLAIYLLCGIIIFFAAGCQTAKHVNTEKQDYDSTYTNTLLDRISSLEKTVAHLENEKIQNQYGRVEFDSTPCPEIQIPDCPALENIDTLKATVNRLNKIISGLNNQVQFNADGSRYLAGRIKSYTFLVESKEKQIIQLQQENKVLQEKLQNNQGKVEIRTVVKEKDVKRSFFAGYGLWILIFFAGIFVEYRFKFFRSLITILRKNPFK